MGELFLDGEEGDGTTFGPGPQPVKNKYSHVKIAALWKNNLLTSIFPYLSDKRHSQSADYNRCCWRAVPGW